MKVLKSFLACFSIYSRIPMPVVKLDSDDMKYVMMFFPLIGAVIGVLEFGLYILCNIYSLPIFVRTLLVMVIPIIITGGIHLDGLMDTMDAFNSYGDREKKLAIMKDPHTGAFAVINLLSYGLLFAAFSYMINSKSIVPFCFSFIFSRIICGISVVTINGAKSDGMIHSVKEKSENSTILAALIIFGIIVTILVAINNPYVACIYVIISAFGYYLYKKKMIKELSGITGDTSGYFLCIMELLFIIVSSIGGFI